MKESIFNCIRKDRFYWKI